VSFGGVEDDEDLQHGKEIRVVGARQSEPCHGVAYYIPLYIRHPRSFVTFEKSHLRGLPVTWYCAHHLIYDI